MKKLVKRFYYKSKDIIYVLCQIYWYFVSFLRLLRLYSLPKALRLYRLDFVSRIRKSLINKRIGDCIASISNDIPGSSTKVGWVYHDYALPELGYKSHRKNTFQRLMKLKKHIPIWKAKVLDIGCSSGGVSTGLALMEAAEVIGVDCDVNAIRVATTISEKYGINNVKFHAKDLNNFDIPEVDIVVWLSNWMWIVKQHGLGYGKDLLFEIPKKSGAQIMVFESAADDGKAAIQGTTQENIECFLRLCSPYTIIKNIGPFRDEWRLQGKKRMVFVCSKPMFSFKGKQAVIRRLDRNMVIKEYEPKGLWAKELESRCLKRLELFPYFPRLLDEGPNWIKMEWVGYQVDKISQLSQLGEIVKILKNNRIIHRDICPENLLYKDEILHLIDFEWAIVDGVEPPMKPAKGIGRGFYNYGDWDDSRAAERLLSTFAKNRGTCSLKK